MGKTMLPYVVRQGDYLAKLAFVHGFDADDVWSDPKNDDLRKLRPDPNILAPGDILFIPGKQEGGGISIQKGAENAYGAEVPKVTTTIVLRDADGNPLADEPYTIEGLGEMAEQTTGGDGKVVITTPVSTGEVTLVLRRRSLRMPVRIGHLDPLEEPSGVRMRLAHLGYLPSADTLDADLLTTAILAFQRVQGLEETGAPDAGTLEALRAAHGS